MKHTSKAIPSTDQFISIDGVKTTSSRKGDIIAYHDSIYIEYLQHDYRADVHLAMENYRNIIYRDSFSIARGTVNPLRFLEYKFSAFSLTDEKYL